MITVPHHGTSVAATAASPLPGTVGTAATGPPPLTEVDGHTRDAGLHVGSGDHRPGSAMINKISTSAVTLMNTAMSDGKTRQTVAIADMDINVVGPIVLLWVDFATIDIGQTILVVNVPPHYIITTLSKPPLATYPNSN